MDDADIGVVMTTDEEGEECFDIAVSTRADSVGLTVTTEDGDEIRMFLRHRECRSLVELLEEAEHTARDEAE